MTKITCCNKLQLEKVVEKIWEDFSVYKELNISWEKSIKIEV